MSGCVCVCVWSLCVCAYEKLNYREDFIKNCVAELCIEGHLKVMQDLSKSNTGSRSEERIKFPKNFDLLHMTRRFLHP